MSWLGILNFCILQWFYIRLVKIVDNRNLDRIINWKIMKGIKPLSGWWNSYKYTKRYKEVKNIRK